MIDAHSGLARLGSLRDACIVYYSASVTAGCVQRSERKTRWSRENPVTVSLDSRARQSQSRLARREFDALLVLSEKFTAFWIRNTENNNNKVKRHVCRLSLVFFIWISKSVLIMNRWDWVELHRVTTTIGECLLKLKVVYKINWALMLYLGKDVKRYKLNTMLLSWS